MHTKESPITFFAGIINKSIADKLTEGEKACMERQQRAIRQLEKDMGKPYSVGLWKSKKSANGNMPKL